MNKKFRYKIYGLYVEADRELLTAEKYTGHREDMQVRVTEGELEQVLFEVMQFQEKNGSTNAAGESAWLVSRVSKEESVLYSPGIGVFCIKSGREIVYRKFAEADDMIFEQWLLNMCLGTLLIQREEVLLHGSALCLDDKAILISGESGSGKSTLTDALLADGYGFVADDAVAIQLDGKIKACGAYPLRRLCADVVKELEIPANRLFYLPDGGRDKYGVNMQGEYHEGPLEVGALFILQPDDVETVQLAEITGSEKLKYIMEALYKKDTYKAMGIGPVLFEKLLKTAAGIPVYVLKRPLRGMTVAEQIKTVDAQLKNLVYMGEKR